jgi:hypothetical protein
VFGGGGWAFAADYVALSSVSAYGTIHAGGVVAVVAGDDDRDATASLEWRLAGGGVFQAAHPLIRIDATHFVGSLFALSPATAYEVRVTLADPDGVSGGNPATAALATRSDTLPEPTGGTLYVAPGGDDGNAGTDPAHPLRTIQRAADLALAGDLVSIAPGVYRESVSVPRSGTAVAPIVFRGSAPGAILDGADAAIAAGVAWSAVGGGVYSRVTGFATGHVVADPGRLFRYDSLAALQVLAAGAPGGYFFDGATLYVRFADNSAPSTHTMHVAQLEDGFVIEGRSFVRIEDLEIRHYGAGDYGKGVYLRYASDCAVRSCRIDEIGSAGVWVKGGERNLIEDNEIWDTSIFGWPWGETKGSSAENNAVTLTNADAVGIRLGDGDGGFGPTTAFASGGDQPIELDFGTLDGDNGFDLAVGNYAGMQLAILHLQDHYATVEYIHHLSAEEVAISREPQQIDWSSLVAAASFATRARERTISQLAGPPEVPSISVSTGVTPLLVP